VRNDNDQSPPAAAHDARQVWTEQRIRALGTLTDIPTAGRIFGLGRARAYELAKLGDFPVPIIPIGARFKVPVAGILTTLGLAAGGDLTGPAKRSVDHHNPIRSPDPQHTTQTPTTPADADIALDQGAP
jgi:hypothetical protein